MRPAVISFAFLSALGLACASGPAAADATDACPAQTMPYCSLVSSDAPAGLGSFCAEGERMRIELADGKIKFQHAIPGFLTRNFTAERNADTAAGPHAEFARFLKAVEKCIVDRDCPKPTGSPFILAFETSQDTAPTIAGHYELYRSFGSQENSASGSGLLDGLTLPKADRHAYLTEIGNKWFMIFSDANPVAISTEIMNYNFIELREDEARCLK